MKAAIYEKYGPADVLEIKETPRPEIKDNEVLVKVFASAVTTADWRLRAAAYPGIMWLPGRMFTGLFRPRNKVLGGAFSGRVVSVGPNVKRFRLGDAVFGMKLNGAHAEYLAIDEDGAIVKKPEMLTHDEAAALPFGATSAIAFLRDFAKIVPGEKVLIPGASGAVGVYAVQFANHMGAEVTALTSTGNVELVEALGAHHVIDYTRENVTDHGDSFDVVLDPAGVLTPKQAFRVLRKGGRFVPLEMDAPEIWAKLTGKPIVLGISSIRLADMEMIADLAGKGTLRPVIDSTYPLHRIADAHRHVENRHKSGTVVLEIDRPAESALAAE